RKPTPIRSPPPSTRQANDLHARSRLGRAAPSIPASWTDLASTVRGPLIGPGNECRNRIIAPHFFASLLVRTFPPELKSYMSYCFPPSTTGPVASSSIQR